MCYILWHFIHTTANYTPEVNTDLYYFLIGHCGHIHPQCISNSQTTPGCSDG